MCLEGLFLTLLDDLPPRRERRLSKNWKRKFHQRHLGTDREAEVVKRLGRKCSELFPLELIEARRNEIPVLRGLFAFLGI